MWRCVFSSFLLGNPNKREEKDWNCGNFLIGKCPKHFLCLSFFDFVIRSNEEKPCDITLDFTKNNLNIRIKKYRTCHGRMLMQGKCLGFLGHIVYGWTKVRQMCLFIRYSRDRLDCALFQIIFGTVWVIFSLNETFTAKILKNVKLAQLQFYLKNILLTRKVQKYDCSAYHLCQKYMIITT